MPRIYTSTNDALDFCAQCIPSEGVAYSLYGKLGNGPDNRGNCFGYDAEHPDYEGEGYQCETCKKTLTALDNETVPALAWDDPRCYRIDAEGNKY